MPRYRLLTREEMIAEALRHIVDLLDMMFNRTLVRSEHDAMVERVRVLADHIDRTATNAKLRIRPNAMLLERPPQNKSNDDGVSLQEKSDYLKTALSRFKIT